MGGSINQNVLADLYVHDPLNTMLEFGKERQDIYTRKERGDPWPWTSDATLQKYKFCNIFRDQDKTTQQIVQWVENIGNPQKLFTNLVYARMCNNIDVLVQTGHIGQLTPKGFVSVIDRISGGKTKGKVNKNTVWKDPYQIAGIFKAKLGYPYREQLIAYHLPEKSAELYEVVKLHAGEEDLTNTLEDLAQVWGYRMNMVFTHALLDLSYRYPGFVNPNASYPMGDGARPTLKILGDISLDKIVQAWGDKYPNERQLLRADAEGLLCEWRKYLVWSNGLAKKYRLYKHS